MFRGRSFEEQVQAPPVLFPEPAEKEVPGLHAGCAFIDRENPRISEDLFNRPFPRVSGSAQNLHRGVSGIKRPFGAKGLDHRQHPAGVGCHPLPFFYALGCPGEVEMCRDVEHCHMQHRIPGAQIHQLAPDIAVAVDGRRGRGGRSTLAPVARIGERNGFRLECQPQPLGAGLQAHQLHHCEEAVETAAFRSDQVPDGA